MDIVVAIPVGTVSGAGVGSYREIPGLWRTGNLAGKTVPKGNLNPVMAQSIELKTRMGVNQMSLKMVETDCQRILS